MNEQSTQTRERPTRRSQRSQRRPVPAANQGTATHGEPDAAVDTQVISGGGEEGTKVAKRLKIIVYAIAKNEIKFVKRWMDSMREADAVVVLDTGSRDGTVKALEQEGAKVETKTISPWRFDTARNQSMDIAMALHPDADLLVCTDLDEYFIKGWRDVLEETWIAARDEVRSLGGKELTTAQYEYIWNFMHDGSDGIKYLYEKIHTPQSGARWTHPVHEVLEYPGDKCMVRIPNIRLEHHADIEKSRSQYLALLEMSVREAPNDDRNCHYLCREYMFRKMWDKCIETGKRHLALPSAKWKAERANTMRFIATAYGEKREELLQEIWLWRAITECETQREACLDLAEALHKRKDWHGLIKVCELLLSRNDRQLNYITRAEAWGSRPWDLYAVGLWNVRRQKEAFEAVQKAIELSPDNARLQKNAKIMREYLESSDTTK